jgi:hypothetical protein
MDKSGFENIGITLEYFAQIFGMPIQNYEVSEVKKGALLRAELYEFKISPVQGEQFAIFAKDFWPGSGDVEEIEKNEVRFLQFGQEHKAFTPKYFGHKEHEVMNGQKRTLLFMEKYEMSLEDKLLEIWDLMCKTEKKGEKKEIETHAFELVRRTIDILTINKYIATQRYKSAPLLKGSTVHKYDLDEFKTDINNFIFELTFDKYFSELTKEQAQADSLMINLRKCYESKFTWNIGHNLSRVLEELYKNIAEPLARAVDERPIVNYDANVGNILLKNLNSMNLSPNEYPPDMVIQLRDGKTKEAAPYYDGFAVTDNNKIGRGSHAMVGLVLAHPAVFRIFSEERMKHLKDHAFAQCHKLQTGERIIALDAVDSSKRKQFDDEFWAVMRYGCLRNAKFAARQYTESPQSREKFREFGSRNPLYSAHSFINANLDYFCHIRHDEEYLKLVNEAIKELKIKRG